MNIEQIKLAIESGKTVCWKTKNYIVSKDKIGQYLITCTNNNTSIGLTWTDGITLNGNKNDFFVIDTTNMGIYVYYNGEDKLAQVVTRHINHTIKGITYPLSIEFLIVGTDDTVIVPVPELNDFININY